MNNDAPPHLLIEEMAITAIPAIERARFMSAWWKECRTMHQWLLQLRKPRVLILAGPTCVGKTALSINLAKKLNGEIISADSVQVYRHLDVGSNKIRVEQMDGIQHHLIDICEPCEDYSCGRFVKEARIATQDIISVSKKTPIVVGGTGFYLKWFVHGVAETKKSTKETRGKAENHLKLVSSSFTYHKMLSFVQLWDAAMADTKVTCLDEEEKWAIAVEALRKAGDPEAAERIFHEKNNYYRLTRALEIILETERQMSTLSINTNQALVFDFRCCFLYRPRLEIYHRIEHRCEEMLQGGILEEAQMLLDCGLLPNTNSATRSIGYRQSMEFLQNVKKSEIELTDKTIQTFLMEFEAATRKLVKQQITWFRSEPLYKWIDVAEQAPSPEQAILQEWKKLKLPGNNKETGLLSEQEKNLLKRYQPTLHYYDDIAHRMELLDCVKSLTKI